jgi:S1-C subfamily serine protease
MRNAVAALSLASVVFAPSSARASTDPAAGTVFIRIVGSIRVLTGGEDGWQKKVLLDLPQVEVASGSGFIFSPLGWVITNHHVISGEKLNAVIDGVRVEISLNPERFEVVLPGDGAPRRFPAAVYATDPDLDLAVLSLGAQDLPYVALGDSDVVVAGDPVQAVGYPFGAALEIGRTRTAETVPSVSISSGSISALRRDDQGAIRYLQTSAQLNPGNSGGPIVDPDGYVVAIAQMVLAKNAAVGFGIPVNLAKAFLKRHGLDQNLSASLLSLGGFFDASEKGIRLRLPEGVQDLSPGRLRVEAPVGSGNLALRIDRIATRWTLEQIEGSLLTGEMLEGFQASGNPRRASRAEKDRRIVSGLVKGFEPATNRELTMLYVLADLGREKLVARYVGTTEALALNRSVLQASLAELEAKPLLVDEINRPPGTALTTLPSSVPGSPPSVVPSGWLVETGAPSECKGVGPAAYSYQTSPVGDFTVSFRAAWWSTSIDLVRAARGCGRQAGPLGEASYASRVAWLGTSYAAQGAFASAPAGGVWQLEMVVPDVKSSLVSPLFETWVKAMTAR